MALHRARETVRKGTGSTLKGDRDRQRRHEHDRGHRQGTDQAAGLPSLAATMHSWHYAT